jgi:hypothetical protein
MLEKPYSKYFQKSRSFLFPALGIKRSSNFTPVETYLALPGHVEPEDMMLVCTYMRDESEGFKKFEKALILDNPMFVSKLISPDMYIYIFNYKMYQDDWFTFLLGKYSKLSSNLKKQIKNYYGEHSVGYKYMESFLFPENHFEEYAKMLDVSLKRLKEVGELCSPCDLEKETLNIPVENLEVCKEFA